MLQQTMIVHLNALREGGEPFRVDSDFTDLELKVQDSVSSLRGPAHAQMRVVLSGERVIVDGTVAARLLLVCSRCLKSFPAEVSKSFSLEYWPDPAVEFEGEELELEYRDLEVGFYRDDKIDLTAAVTEQIVLEIPMKPICREDCKGLCDQCGADLNEGNCGCEKMALDPRLQVLRDVRKKFEDSD